MRPCCSRPLKQFYGDTWPFSSSTGKEREGGASLRRDPFVCGLKARARTGAFVRLRVSGVSTCVQTLTGLSTTFLGELKSLREKSRVVEYV